MKDKKEGWGTAYCTNGDIYVGHWISGKRHGHGTFTTYGSDKSVIGRYTGDWKNSKRDGFGVQENYDRDDESGTIVTTVMEGCWKDNLFHGWGRLYKIDDTDPKVRDTGSDSLCYEGNWLEGARDGVGLAIFPNGDKFEGTWRKDKREGPGRYWYAETYRGLRGVWSQDILKTGEMDGKISL